MRCSSSALRTRPLRADHRASAPHGPICSLLVVGTCFVAPLARRRLPWVVRQLIARTRRRILRRHAGEPCLPILGFRDQSPGPCQPAVGGDRSSDFLDGGSGLVLVAPFRAVCVGTRREAPRWSTVEGQWAYSARRCQLTNKPLERTGCAGRSAPGR